MAFCKKCGAQIDDQAVVCPKCGVAQGAGMSTSDNGGFLWGLLGCCIPLVGLILFLVWKDTKPKTSKAAGIGALVGVGLGRILHLFIIETVEVDNAMFGRNINMPSFIYSLLLTVAFSMMINGVMYFKLKKIDMVESLKSIE